MMARPRRAAPSPIYRRLVIERVSGGRIGLQIRIIRFPIRKARPRPPQPEAPR